MLRILLALSLLSLLSCSENKPTTTETFIPGFKTLTAKDTARIYKPNTDTSDYLHYRPLDIDMWYPATASVTDTAMSFRNILALLEKRANYYTASNANSGLTQQLAQYFCEGLKCSDSAKLLNWKTASTENATPAKGKFPVVIYMAAFNGMSYENFSLFEELTRAGFIVISISSIGRFPGDMTMKKEDLAEQVNDALASIKILKQTGHMDFNKIGIVGYSWGGLAGSILAGKLPEVGAVVSLDGSEFHRYGKAIEENADFDDLRSSPEFSSLKVSAPYLRLESAYMSQDDSTFNFHNKLASSSQILVIDSARHEDFGSLPQIVKKSGNCLTDHRHETISKLTISFLQEQLQDKKTFTQTLDQETGSNHVRKKH
jgi:esterase/lipase